MTKQQLVAELTKSRAAIVRDTASLRRELDVPTKVSHLVANKPFAFLGGAAVLGWVLAGPKRKTRTVTKYVAGKEGRVERRKESRDFSLIGMLFALLKLASPLLKPAVSAFAAKRVAEMVARVASK